MRTLRQRQPPIRLAVTASQYNRLATGIDRVDASAAPPTETDTDRYLLDSSTPVHADWDGASVDSVVEYDSGDDTWNETVPSDGDVITLSTPNEDWLFLDGAWTGGHPVGTGDYPAGDLGNTFFIRFFEAAHTTTAQGDQTPYTQTFRTGRPKATIQVPTLPASDSIAIAEGTILEVWNSPYGWMTDGVPTPQK